jgi:hypothetical protein
MNRVHKASLFGIFLVSTLSVFTGCTQKPSCDVGLKDSLSQKDREVAQLQNIIQDRAMFPPKAKIGSCYARVLTPAKFTTVKEKVLVQEASKKLIEVPAKYKLVTKKVLVSEASSRLITTKPVFRNVKEKILVAPESTKLINIPAKYTIKTVKILVAPEYTEWVKDRGILDNVLKSKTNFTGETLHLVKVPAKYRVQQQKILLKPAYTITKKIPAKYKVITKKVVDRPATTKKVEIPAKYKVVHSRELVSPATAKSIEIPAKYKVVTKKIKAKNSSLSWEPVVCKSDLTPQRVMIVQRALKQRGFNPGDIDGIIGLNTQNALTNFQNSNNLLTGALTIESVRALGVYR